MSANTLIHLLESMKVRDRNEALDLIEHKFPSLYCQDIKEILAICKSLVHLIELESLQRAKNTTAVGRMKRGSFILRITIEQSLLHLPPRASSYINLLPQMIKIIDLEIFIDIIKTLKLILRQQYIKDHLNVEVWQLLIQFFIEELQNQHQIININELLDGLNILFAVDTGIVFLPLLTADHSQLIDILEQHYVTYKNDTYLCLHTFKLINQLLIILANQDFKLQAKLIKFGFGLLQNVKYNFKNYLPVNEQVLIFLNLDCVHQLIDWDSNGDSEGMLHNVKEILNYLLTNMNLFSKLSYSDTIGFIIDTNRFTEEPSNWFALNTIYLKFHEPSFWLLLRGCCKLLDVYYKLTKKVGIVNESLYDLKDSMSKRRRLDLNIIQTYLSTSDNSIAFLEKLITNDAIKYQQMGLLILCFHLEMKSLNPPKDSDLREEGVDSFMDPDEADFDWSTSLLVTSNETTQGSMINLLLTASNNKLLMFLSLLALNSLIFNLARSDLKVPSDSISRILKLTLPHAKSDEVCDVSSHLLYNLMEYVEIRKIDLSKISDPSLINQVSNIVELSSFSGPAKLNNCSYKFWVAFVRLMKGLGLNTNNLNSNISDWILFKWNQKFDINSGDFCLEFDCFPKFFVWLMGLPLKHNPPIANYDSYKGRLLLINQTVLRNSILLNFQYRFDQEFLASPSLANGLLPGPFNETFYFNKVMQRFTKMKDEFGPDNVDKKLRYLVMVTKLLLNDPKNQELEAIVDTVVKGATPGQKYELMKSLPQDEHGILFAKYCGFLTNRVFPPFKTDDFVARPNDLELFDNTTKALPTLSIYQVELQDSQLQFIDPVLNMIRSSGTKFSGYVGEFYKWMKSLTEKELLYVSYQLPQIDLPWTDISDTDSKQSLVLLGQKPMRNGLYERNELTFVAICKMVILFIDLGKHEAIVVDIIQWLLMASSKKLILTISSCTEFMRLLLHVMVNRTSLIANKLDFTTLLDRFFEYFKFVDSTVRLNLVPTINQYMSQLTGKDQMGFYRGLIECFSLSGTFENVLEYCSFLGLLSSHNFQITSSSIFNLFEIGSLDVDCDNQNQYVIKKAFRLIARNWHVDEFNQIFHLAKISVFRSWFLHHKTFDNFPYTIIGCKSVTEFYYKNRLNLLSMSLALSPSSPEDLTRSINICQTTEIHSYILDTIPLLFPIAYTKGGIRNQIQVKMTTLLNEKVHVHVQARLSFIILETIRLLDVSDLQTILESNQMSMNLPKIYNPLSIYLSASSGFELMNSLIKKYSLNFWTLANVYFMSKRLVIDLEDCVNMDQKQMVLRRLLLVLIFGKGHIINGALLKLLIVNVVPLVRVQQFSGEFKVLFTLFNISLWEEYEFTHELMVMVLATLVEIPPELLGHIIPELQQYRNGQHLNGDRLISLVIELLSKEPLSEHKITTTDIEQVDGSYIHLFKLYSYCLQNGVELVANSNETQMVRAILDTPLSGMDPRFKLHCAAILNSHYLSQEMCLEEHLMDEFDQVENGNYLDKIISVVIEYQADPNCKISTIADLTMGALLNEENLVELVDDLNHIFTVDSHIIGLYFSDTPNTHFGEFSEPFNTWTRKHFGEILNESSLNPHQGLDIIKRFGNTVTGFTSKCLPYIICYFCERTNQKYGVITHLINEFLSTETLHSRLLAYIILKTILMIRQATKTHISFSKIYENLNLLKVGEIAAKFNFFKTSLMLLEHGVSTERITSWADKPYVERLFESIDDSDLIDGLPQETNLQTALKSIWRHNESTERIKFEFANYDSKLLLNLEANPGDSNLIDTMLYDGMTGTSRMIGSNIPGEHSDNVYEWSWKLNQWTLTMPEKPETTNEFIYKALKLIHDYPETSGTILDKILLDIVDGKDQVLAMNNAKHRQQALDRFYQNLSIISSIYSINIHKGSYDDHDLNQILNQDWLYKSLFDAIDHLMLSRVIGFHLMGTSNAFDYATKGQCLNNVVTELVRYNDLAITHRREQKMINSLMLINGHSTNPESMMTENSMRLSKYQTSKGLWAQKHSSMAIAMLKELQDTIDKYGDTKRYFDYAHNGVSGIMVVSTLIEWLSESKQELPVTIMENYVDTIKPELVNHSSGLNGTIYAKLARFCEVQYKSTELNAKLAKIETQSTAKRYELDKIKDHYGKISVPIQEKKSVQKYYSKLKLQYTNEINDYNDLKDTKTKFLIKSVENYLNHVKHSDDNFESVDKFFSLWFEDANNDTLNSLIKENIDQILALNYKFATWSSQLISKLSNDSSLFQDLVQDIIKDVCLNHPFHSLYHLFSLKAHEVKANESSNQFMLSKVLAANRILGYLRLQDRDYVQTYLNPIDKFCQQSLSLSNHKVSRGKTLNLNKIGTLGEYWVDHLASIPPPTMGIKLMTSREQYNDLPNLESMDPVINIASSGLSLPKITKFRLSNGEQVKVLFKYGTDDLRQDAIMEQVFEKVNEIFLKNRETSKRNLRVRTYKIVPIGPNSGLIEFVPNSVAFIDIVKPYHSLRDGMKYEKARELMKDYQTEDKSERIKIFHRILDKVSPVLKEFFFDNYLTPKNWYETKVTYSHGLATSSIVGYMLGLGDRHCNNILLDKNTGEPIHIDLGVAFDQGSRLPIPETVPFRLTPDLVDGLGITGVEGIFRKSCEETFQVLRDNQDHIISILNILKWDPLYSWSLSPLRIRQLQNENDLNNNFEQARDDISEAGQALLKVQDKLLANGLSKEAVIRELIINATDRNNLALIYCGWCPFY